MSPKFEPGYIAMTCEVTVKPAHSMAESHARSGVGMQAGGASDR